jgi:hypothetical protein
MRPLGTNWSTEQTASPMPRHAQIRADLWQAGTRTKRAGKNTPAEMRKPKCAIEGGTVSLQCVEAAVAGGGGHERLRPRQATRIRKRKR